MAIRMFVAAVAVAMATFMVVVASALPSGVGVPTQAVPVLAPMTSDPRPSSVNCTIKWFTQDIDHFGWSTPLSSTNATTFRQRYFVYDKYWSTAKDGTRGPIFFYFGNEDNVELYVNHTGLMWESASHFGALLVFAEHRFYGESKPFPSGTAGCMNYLSTEQAMADFATLIDDLKHTLPGTRDSAVIGFGGSYGGMVGSWFKMHYPNKVDGVIAASAPIWSFVGLDPPYDFDGFDAAVTYDASAAAGATDHCKANIKQVWPKVAEATGSDAGRALLKETFRLCNEVAETDSEPILEWLNEPWGFLAMGNYPYPSTYLVHGLGPPLPAWPMRAACKGLDKAMGDDRDLFVGMREAVAVYFNRSKDKPCFDHTQFRNEGPLTAARMPGKTMTARWRRRAAVRDDSCTGDWGYQWCTEMVQPFSSGTANDMFWPLNEFNLAESKRGCQDSWGVTPRELWARRGLASKYLGHASNIVFSNGRLDPWHPGGVLENQTDTVVAVVIPNGAHHIDLMFSDPQDTPDILQARDFERAHIARWIEERASKRHLRGAA
eukprot:m.488688 g.488688  ORF g.488688 m.488688 type:complete len:548 (-) comp26024_c0_seq1:82-1725(-)